MKTNILILLALGTSASIINAAAPAAQLKKSPATTGPAFRSSVSMPAKLIRGPQPSVPVNRPAVPVVKPGPAVPKNIGVLSGPVSLTRQGTGSLVHSRTRSPSGGTTSDGRRPAEVRPGSQGAPSVEAPGIGSHASIPATKPSPRMRSLADERLGGINIGGAREGFQTPGGLSEMDKVRNSLPEGLGELGPRGNRSGAPGAPDLTFGEGNYSGRKITNPLDRSSNGGLTDIRGSASNSRKGHETDRSHLSGRGQDLLNFYSPGGTSRYGTTGSQTGEQSHVGHSSHGSSSTTVTEDRDTRGHLTGTTLETGHASRRSTDYKAVHFDGTGRTQDVVVTRENQRTGEQTKDVYSPNGDRQSHTSSRDVPTPRDTTPQDGDGSKNRTGAQTCGINPADGGSFGGVGGPSVKQSIGLTHLDLLRQTEEGQQTSSSGGYFVNGGRRSGNEVCPIGESRSSGQVNRVAPIDLLRPTGGGNDSVGGGDRPN